MAYVLVSQVRELSNQTTANRYGTAAWTAVGEMSPVAVIIEALVARISLVIVN